MRVIRYKMRDVGMWGLMSGAGGKDESGCKIRKRQGEGRERERGR